MNTIGKLKAASIISVTAKVQKLSFAANAKDCGSRHDLSLYPDNLMGVISLIDVPS